VIRLRYLREKAGMTRQSLGAASSVGPARVGAMELGRIVPRDDSVELFRLATALGYPPERADELLEDVTGDAAD
jgi:transcriptional regulator with XRE-family HTH domain